jgi:hypothetical protein
MVKTESLQEACQRLDGYSRRWGIEVYHHTLKSGRRIEDRRLEDTESLETRLAIDLVVAWRVHWLTCVSREKPHTACDPLFERRRVACFELLGHRHDGRDISQGPRGDTLDRQDGRLADEGKA